MVRDLDRPRDAGRPKLEESRPSLSPALPEVGRLGARPGRPTVPPLGPGLHALGLEAGRDALLFVPSGYQPGKPAPLVVMLHGAGGNARGGLDPLLGFAEDAGVLLLSPDSRGRTWDIIHGAFGPDVAFLDEALAYVFERYEVDAAQVAVGGFSDGASYALSLGLTNGDLFKHVIAYSPGFAAPGDLLGSPRLFISHGTDDRVLPITRTSRRMVPMLERQGYDLEYRKFSGGHAVPPEIAREGLEWFLKGSPP